MRELFIYYRATVDNADALQAAAVAMQANLQSRYPGLLTRLLRRPEPVDGLHTWMEIYAWPLKHDGLCDPAGNGISPALQQEIEAAAYAALATWLRGPRHTEVFVPCAF